MKLRQKLVLGSMVAMSAAFALDSSLPPPQPANTSGSAYVRAKAKLLSEAALERARVRAKARALRQEMARKRASETITQPAAAPDTVAEVPASQEPPTPKPLTETPEKSVAPLRAKPAKKPIAAAKPAALITEPTLLAVRPATPEPTTPATAPVARSRNIPKGFEEWFAPQKTAVDLYYGGRFLMSTLVEYTLDNVTFLNPPEVAARIPGLRSPADASLLLADPLPTHADKVCIHPNQPLCGRLDTSGVGVIFDETRFRADLFVHPSLLLDARQVGSRQYLPEPVHDHPTLVQNLSALYSGSTSGENRFSLFGRTRLGLGRSHGFANWASTEKNALSMDELGYTRDLQDIQITAGLFEPEIDALRAVPRQPIMGVSVARSLLTRTDMESMIASPIELFLPIRGRVDIFRDGRLISTGFYEAGNQSIDTSHLPGGAYNIEIVVTDVTGSTRTTQQLFIKSSLMAPPGEPLWFVDAGEVMQRAPLNSFPNDFGVQQLRGGYRWRQNPWLGFGAAGALTSNEGFAELSAGVLLGWLEGSAELFGSSTGGTGFGLRGATRRDGWTASASLQQTAADEASIPPGEYRLLTSDQSLTSLFISHPLWQGQASASLSQSDRRGNSSRRITLGYNRTFPLGGYHSLQLQTEVGDEDGNAMAMLTLQWRNIRGQWSDSAQVRLSQSDTGTNTDTFSAGAATTWNDGDRYVDDVQFGLRAEAGDRNKSLTLDGQHRSQYGRGSASLTTSDSNGSSQTLASLGYDTSFVVGEEGKTAFGGGPDQGESAVILDLHSAPDALLEVSADGQRQFIARGGSNTALTLGPYHQYRIRLKDSGLALSQLDDQPHEVTLYPGHVVNMNWAIRSIQVLVGRVLTADGQPLANARIEGAEGVSFTDSDGFIQTEMISGTTELKATQGTRECSIRLPATPAGEAVIRLMNLRCTDATEKAASTVALPEGPAESSGQH